MLGCCCYALGRSLLLWLWLPRALLAHGWRSLPKRLGMFVLVLPLFCLLQCVHWLGMLVDELLFRGWRKACVNNPLFISGVPRSGTTFLQRTLAHDQRFTTTPFWEAVLAPSITEKYLWSTLFSILSPLKRRLHLGDRGFLSKMKHVHSLGLNKPEEDFIFLTAMNACFILVALYPTTPGIWRLTRFDSTFADWEKRVIMRYYQACVKKHLWFWQRRRQRTDLVFLSKNPTFISMIGSLRQTFPEACFVFCVREPCRVVPSQISALQPAFALLADGSLPQGFVKHCVDMLHSYYVTLNAYANSAPRTLVVQMNTLTEQLPAVVTDIYRRLDMESLDTTDKFLQEQGGYAQQYQSSHRYQLCDYGLTKAAIADIFADVWPMSRAPS